VTPEASGVWGTIQEWLARANREYQGVVVKQLSLPPSGGSAGEDEIARKLKDEQADETRKAAEAKKLADEKAAAQATTEGAKALDADRKKAEETKRLADEAKKKADELFKTEKAEKAKLPEAPAAAPQPDEAALAAEQQKLEAERQAEEAKWQKAANDARHAEEQRKKAEAVAAATAEEDRRRATELAAAEKHRSRTIVITPEPIARPVDRGTSFRREMPSARWAADMADAEDTPSPAPQRRRIRVIRVIREATYRGIDPNAYRGTTVKRWVWRSNGSGCHAAGRRVTPPARYTIKRGDSLWRISERHYNAGRLYRKIYRANRSRIEDPDLIYPCQRVLVPR
jgi:nucleoid-associated protein YgaU